MEQGAKFLEVKEADESYYSKYYYIYLALGLTWAIIFSLINYKDTFYMSQIIFFAGFWVVTFFLLKSFSNPIGKVSWGWSVLMLISGLALGLILSIVMGVVIPFTGTYVPFPINFGSPITFTIPANVSNAITGLLVVGGMEEGTKAGFLELTSRIPMSESLKNTIEPKITLMDKQVTFHIVPYIISVLGWATFHMVLNPNLIYWIALMVSGFFAVIMMDLGRAFGSSTLLFISLGHGLWDAIFHIITPVASIIPLLPGL